MAEYLKLQRKHLIPFKGAAEYFIELNMEDTVYDFVESLQDAAVLGVYNGLISSALLASSVKGLESLLR